jgi:hypothetical protein
VTNQNIPMGLHLIPLLHAICEKPKAKDLNKWSLHFEWQGVLFTWVRGWVSDKLVCHTFLEHCDQEAQVISVEKQQLKMG